MGKFCCIKGCNVSSPDVEYYKFPLRGALLTAWVSATGAPGGDVCAAHFTSDDYKNVRGKRRLLHTAVPSVLCKPPSTENGEIASTDTDTPRKNIKKTASTSLDTPRRMIKKFAKVNPKNKKAKAKEKNILEPETEESDKETQNTESNKEDIGSNKDLEETKETIDKDKAIDNDTTEKANSDRESSQDSVDTTQSDGKEKMDGNGKEKNAETAPQEVNDIEEMITNYQIKQTKTLADRLNPEPLEDLIPVILARANDAIQSQASQPALRRRSLCGHGDGQTANQNRLDMSQLASQLSDKLDGQLAQMSAAPVFIEVAVDQGTTRAESPQDCVMLLESVQCDIDPSSLMLPEHGPETDSDMEIVEPDVNPKKEDSRKEDPISLLTSSDEDDVILEEPHIDTVEVSDETDEDDKPLLTLLKAGKPKSDKKKGNYEWGYKEYQCVHCEFKTNDEAEFKQHNLELGHVNSTTIQICPTCNYTTASKAQFSRHKRKHKDERNFKCHLCNYKARHNMSLIYHLKCHAPAEKEKKKSEKFTCDKCGFSSNVKSEALNHLKLKACDGNKYACDQCSYSTKRRSDLRRHMLRRHSVDDSDEDFTV